MHTACRAKGERPQLKNWPKLGTNLLLDSHNGRLEFKKQIFPSIFEIVKCCVKYRSWKHISWNDCDFNLLRNFWFRDPDPDVVSALCSRVLYVGLGGVVVGLDYSGDPHPPTRTVAPWRWKAVQVLFRHPAQPATTPP